MSTFFFNSQTGSTLSKNYALVCFIIHNMIFRCWFFFCMYTYMYVYYMYDGTMYKPKLKKKTKLVRILIFVRSNSPNTALLQCHPACMPATSNKHTYNNNLKNCFIFCTHIQKLCDLSNDVARCGIQKHIPFLLRFFVVVVVLLAYLVQFITLRSSRQQNNIKMARCSKYNVFIQISTWFSSKVCKGMIFFVLLKKNVCAGL